MTNMSMQLNDTNVGHTAHFCDPMDTTMVLSLLDHIESQFNAKPSILHGVFTDKRAVDLPTQGPKTAACIAPKFKVACAPKPQASQVRERSLRVAKPGLNRTFFLYGDLKINGSQT
ncbi:MAG: hypothetical protein ABJD13_16145 [Paracoccaceae bacterium]